MQTMSKSIETMWKDGFSKDEDFLVPKVNDLYNRKSQNIVDRLQRMFALNIKAIIIGGLIMLTLMSINGMPFLGLYICLLLTPLVFIAKKELDKSKEVTQNLSKSQTSYDYLMSFDQWLKSSIATYSGFYRYFYPLFFMGMVVRGMVGETGTKIIADIQSQFPTDVIILGLPYYLVLAVATLLVVVILSSDALYRLDLKIIYGRQFKKLDELIAEMKELKS
jgi:hypothetical protein